MVPHGWQDPCFDADADDTLRATNLWSFTLRATNLRSFTRIGGLSGKRHLCMASLQLEGRAALGNLPLTSS